MSDQNYYTTSPTAYSKPRYSSPQPAYQYPSQNQKYESFMNQAYQSQQCGAPQPPSQNVQTQYNQSAASPPNTSSQLPYRSFKEYLRNLPMFTLLTEHEAKARQEGLKIAADLHGSVQPEPQLNSLEKVSMHLMDATTGGVMNVNKYTNNLVKFQAKNMTNLAAVGNTVTLTRWAYVPDDTGNDTAGIVLVDVLQCRRSKSLIGVTFNSAYVKAAAVGSEAVALTVLGKNLTIKGDKMWTKTMSSKDVDGVLLESRIQMEPLMSVQSTMSIAELAEALKRFEHAWRVPRL